MKSFPWSSYLLWAVNSCLQAVILWNLIRRRTLPLLWTLRAVLAVALITDAACLFALVAGGMHSKVYWWTFWTAQGAEMLLRAGLAFQILTSVMRPYLRELVTAGVFASAWLAYLLVRFIPLASMPDMLTIAAAGNLIGSLLVATSIVIPSPDEEWPRGWSAVAFGLFGTTALELLISQVHRHYVGEYYALFALLGACAPIPGLLLWYFAARDGKAPKARGTAA
jgi:hypothetical protein